MQSGVDDFEARLGDHDPNLRLTHRLYAILPSCPHLAPVDSSPTPFSLCALGTSQMMAGSLYSPYTARKTSHISPIVAWAFTHSTTWYMVFSSPSAALRSAS